MDDEVKSFAGALFVVHLLGSFLNRQMAEEWETEKVYRHCVAMAEKVNKIDNEEQHNG